MPFDPFETISVGRAGLRTTRLGLGGAAIAGLWAEVTESAAAAVIAHAWSIGVRSFDVAPLYGYGAGEERMGRGLRGRPRADYMLSTKVGRLVRQADAIGPDDAVDEQIVGSRTNAYYVGTGGRRMVLDYSFDGVLRSVEESLARLGLDHLDIAYIHDPDDHMDEALGGAYPALDRLRSEGVVTSIGAGMTRSAPLLRFVTETDVDVIMVAGRYTLLDQGALTDLLPACERRAVSVMVAGVMNSGILADPTATPRMDYAPASPDVLDRVERLAAACSRHGVPLRAAAVQLPLAHPAVTGLVAGARTAAQLDDYPAAMRHAIPPGLWDELRRERLIPADIPTPA